MDILDQQNIPTNVQARMKLEMFQSDPIFQKKQLDAALADKDPKTWRAKLGEKRFIKDSWIYKHFKDESTKKTKIAVYVNAVTPINQNLEPSGAYEPHSINNVGNNCVVVSGLTKWPKNDANGIECLELENNGGCEETRFIPVEFPFFEEIQIEVNKINADYQNKGLEGYNRAMNKLGKTWAEKKWGTIPSKWHELKKKPKEGQKNIDEAKHDKYEMVFVRGIHPCFQLKFTS